MRSERTETFSLTSHSIGSAGSACLLVCFVSCSKWILHMAQRSQLMDISKPRRLPVPRNQNPYSKRFEKHGRGRHTPLSHKCKLDPCNRRCSPSNLVWQWFHWGKSICKVILLGHWGCTHMPSHSARLWLQWRRSGWEAAEETWGVHTANAIYILSSPLNKNNMMCFFVVVLLPPTQHNKIRLVLIDYPPA